MMRSDCQLSWGRECFLTSCWILDLAQYLENSRYSWLVVVTHTRKRTDLAPSLQEVDVAFEDVVIRN